MSDKSEAEHYCRGFVAGMNDVAELVERLGNGAKKGLTPKFIEAGLGERAEPTAVVFGEGLLAIARSIRAKMVTAQAMMDGAKAGKSQ